MHVKVAIERALRAGKGKEDYASAGKPMCDYEDRAAREALVDALAKDAHALLRTLDGRQLSPGVKQAAELLGRWSARTWRATMVCSALSAA